MTEAHRDYSLWLTISRAIMLLVLAGLLYLLVVKRVPVFVWAVIAIAGVVLVLTVTRHARLTTYQCKACGKSFAISAWTDFISPHLPSSKLLRCPSCRKVGWCNVSAKA